MQVHNTNDLGFYLQAMIRQPFNSESTLPKADLLVHWRLFSSRVA
jgi:hypothetical protein